MSKLESSEKYEERIEAIRTQKFTSKYSIPN